MPPTAVGIGAWFVGSPPQSRALAQLPDPGTSGYPMNKAIQSDALLRAAVRAAQVGLWDWDLRSDTVTYSTEWKRLLGYREDEIGGGFAEFESRVHPEDLSRVKQLVTDFLANPWPDYRVEFRMRHKDGSWRWILSQADVERDAKGRPAHMIGSHVDITKQKRAEAELARANRALRMLSDSNQALIRAPDEDALLREVCRVLVEVGGYQMAWVGFEATGARHIVRPIAYAGVDPGEFTAASDTWGEPPNGRGPAATALSTAQPCIVRRTSAPAGTGQKSGSDAWRSVMALPLLTEGRTFGVIKVYSTSPEAFETDEVSILTELAGDIAFGISSLRAAAERARAEAALRRTQANLDQALDAARLGPWSWNIVTGEITWSERCKALYGLPPDAEVTYQRFLDTLHPDDRAATDAALQRAVETRSDYEIEKRVLWPDGSLHWNMSRGRVFSDPEGRAVLMTGVTLDITERRMAEEALRKVAENTPG